MNCHKNVLLYIYIGGGGMSVYWFQNTNILSQIIQEQKVRCDSKYWDEDMRKYYEWMYSQYKQRIGSQEKSLVWCWDEIPEFYFEVDEDDEWNEEYEQRRYRVLLILDVLEERVLWSDYEGWHAPLNDIKILTKEEEREAENGKIFNDTHGWEHVFDFEWFIKNEWSGEIIKQGVFDVVDILDIKEIGYYNAKCKELITEKEFNKRKEEYF